MSLASSLTNKRTGVRTIASPQGITHADEFLPLQFPQWLEERQRITRERYAGHLRPWTLDPVLSKYRFTNVQREFDAGTIILRESLVGADDIRTQVLRSLLYRFLRGPNELWQNGDFGARDVTPQTLKTVVARLHRHQLNRERDPKQFRTLLGRAGQGPSGRDGRSFAQRLVTDPLSWDVAGLSNLVEIGGTLQDIWTTFFGKRQTEGFGGFNGQAVALDCSYINPAISTDEWIHVHTNDNPNNAHDRGPGVSLLQCFGTGNGGSRPQLTMLDLIKKVRNEQKRIFPGWMALTVEPLRRPLTLADIEHAACEHNKYWRKCRGENAGGLRRL
jgi:hypothetical protein